MAELARLAGIGYYRLVRPALGYSRAAKDVRESTAKALSLSVEELWGTD
jgi:hypothetical protein